MANIYNKNNMSSSDVKKMQNALIKAGYSVGKSGADGVWGKDTSAALSAYKKATGGSNSYGNTVGNETFRKLYGTGSSGGSTGGNRTTVNPNSYVSGLNISGNKVTDPNTGSKMTLNAYMNNLRNGQSAFGSENITADPSIRNQWDSALNSAQSSYSSNAGYLGNAYNEGVNQANTNANEAARQQYIAYRQNKNNLGEQLSTNGITGGASETALNQILNSYSANLANAEAARQEALSDLSNEYNSNLAGLMSQLQSNMASINSQYGAMEAEDIANKRQQYAESQLTGLEAYINALNQSKIDNWNANVSARIQEKNPTYVWTDSDGRLHYNNSQSAANAAKAAGYKVVERKDTKKTTSSSTKKSSSSSTKKSSSKSVKDVWSTPTKKTTKKTSTTAKNYKYTSVKKIRGR